MGDAIQLFEQLSIDFLPYALSMAVLVGVILGALLALLGLLFDIS